MVLEYLCSLLVAGWVTIFALAKTSSKTINKLANPNAPLGYGLCFLNLVFDDFTNDIQDSISARYPKTNAWDMMSRMNLWGTVYNAIFKFGWLQASGCQAFQFCKVKSYYLFVIWRASLYKDGFPLSESIENKL